MPKKTERPQIEVVVEKSGGMREAAARAEHVARRLLRRTHLLAHRASRTLPVVPTVEAPPSDDGHLTLPLAPLELALPAASERVEREGVLSAERELTELRRRAARAEHAAAWLRARLRAERTRAAAPPQIDAAALAADLARDLSRLSSHHQEAVLRVVRRRLADYGLPVPVSPARPEQPRRVTSSDVPSLDLPGWSPDALEAVTKAALARAPEVADPTYVTRALELVTRRGRATLAVLWGDAGLASPMSRRRLRLAVEALVALGALTEQRGAYSLNTAYQPPRPDPAEVPLRHAHNQRGGPRRGPARRAR